MVTNVTNLSRSGLFDWLLQRVSAVVLLVYFLIVIGYVLINGGSMAYADWHGFMTCTAMKIFSMLALVMLGVHAWVGMWTISTDYLTAKALGSNATWIRFAFQAICGIAMFAYFVWGLQIFWGGR